MLHLKYFDDYAIDEKYTSQGRIITEDDINLHAEQTGDFFPHHMDEAWCRTQPFKKRIAHGTLIFSVGVGLTATIINEASMTYGYDRLRFIRPVFIGDVIHAVATITGKKEYKKPGYGLVTEKVEVFNQEGKIIMACEHLLLVKKKNEA